MTAVAALYPEPKKKAEPQMNTDEHRYGSVTFSSWIAELYPTEVHDRGAAPETP
jgi:hypothetical protein